MYDDERKILTDRLDKPVIHNRKKSEINTDRIYRRWGKNSISVLRKT